MEMTMGKKTVVTPTTYCVADAISQGMSCIEELRDEMQSWYDNMPEGLQQGDKGSAVEECAQALGAFEYVTVCDAMETADEEGKTEDDKPSPNIGHVRFEFTDSKKKRQSRNDRRNEACALLRAAVDAVRTELDSTVPDDHAPTPDEEQDDQYAETRDDIESCLDELESMLDDVEGADFPGMYG